MKTVMIVALLALSACSLAGCGADGAPIRPGEDTTQ